MRYSILSNGSLITREQGSAIAKSGRCSYTQISLDGATHQTHDIFRGKGSFEGAIRGIKILLDNKVPVTVRVTVHPYNIQELDEIACFLLDDLSLPSFSTNYVSHLGLAECNSPRVQLNTEELSQAMEILVSLNQKYHGRIGASAGPLMEAELFRQMEEARRQGLPSFNGRGHLVACNCPFLKIAVRADGIVIPCTLLAHIELGRINQDSLIEIWQNHPVLNRYRKRNEIPLVSFAYCDGCQWLPYCTGGCPSTGKTLGGDEYQPSPQGCIRSFLDDGGRIPGINNENILV
jgi:SynChlorMet cassette radical SAM/SPASM protein ScmE